MYGKICCDSTNDVHRLKSHGILKELPTGGSIIEANSSSIAFRIPPSLKTTPFWFWTPEDTVWLNI